MSIAATVTAVEEYAKGKGMLVHWDVSDAPLHAGGSPVLVAELLRQREPHHLTIQIDVSGSPILISHKGKTWADGWPWVAHVYSAAQLATAFEAADAGMVEIFGDEKAALVARGAWPGLEYYHRDGSIVMWCRACSRGFRSACSVCGGQLFEPADYGFVRRPGAYSLMSTVGTTPGPAVTSTLRASHRSRSSNAHPSTTGE